MIRSRLSRRALLVPRRRTGRDGRSSSRSRVGGACRVPRPERPHRLRPVAAWERRSLDDRPPRPFAAAHAHGRQRICSRLVAERPSDRVPADFKSGSSDGDLYTIAVNGTDLRRITRDNPPARTASPQGAELDRTQPDPRLPLLLLSKGPGGEPTLFLALVLLGETIP
jgi:hypothetical protein